MGAGHSLPVAPNPAVIILPETTYLPSTEGYKGHLITSYSDFFARLCFPDPSGLIPTSRRRYICHPSKPEITELSWVMRAMAARHHYYL
jgi:hypothetical protein